MTDRAPIVSDGFTIEKLFEGQKYRLASYQREYTWTRAEVRALLVDLCGRFYPQWQRLQRDDADVDMYEPYYLGSIVYYVDGGYRHLVDGQQRITTLHLLLIYLRRLLDDVGTLPDLAAKVRTLIWSRPGHLFTVQIDERTDTLKALMRNERPVVPTNAPVSLRNLIRRYNEIDEEFPYTLRDEALERFVEWLLYRVCVVGIEAENKMRGWEIFETTNDRGIKLGPMDLLKSHLIGQVAQSRQKELSDRWREQMSRFGGFGSKAASEFIRDLIVAKYLKDLGEDARTEATMAVHEWIRLNANDLGLQKSVDYHNFVSEMILKLGSYYQGLLRAVEQYKPDHPWAAVTFLNQHNAIPYHLAAVLASLRPQDSQEEFHDKTRLVGAYLDLLYVRRLVNRPAMRVESLTTAVLNLVVELRTCADVTAVRALLIKKVASLKEKFSGVRKFALSPEVRPQLRYVLARLTAFVQAGVGKPDELTAYLDTANHDIEHIVPNHFDAFSEQNPKIDEKTFPVWRNSFGALLLLPKLQNSSVGDRPYRERVNYYRDQNVLAASLHRDTRQQNQAVKRFVREHGLEKLMHPVDEKFDVEAIKLRQALYQRLCELVWDPARLGLGDISGPEPGPVTPEPAPTVLRERPQVQPRAMVKTPNTDVVRRLVQAGHLKANEKMTGVADGVTYEALVLANGTVELLGETFPDITAAANFVREKASRGWVFWGVKRGGSWVSLANIRRASQRG